MRNGDINLNEFCHYLCLFESTTQYTQKLDHWPTVYESRKIEVLRELKENYGIDCCSEKNTECNISVEDFYNHIKSPGVLLWISGVLGAFSDILESAVKNATMAEQINKHDGAMGFREIIPYSKIIYYLKTPIGWYLDKNLIDSIQVDGFGYPIPINDSYKRILAEEGYY